jgi:predicted permease
MSKVFRTGWLARVTRRLSHTFRRSAVEQAMDDEMRHHLDCEVAERVANGMSEADARRSALLDFGGIERHKEEARDIHGVRPLDDTVRDFRYSLRVLRKNKGFAAAVVLTFALGIGCSCAIFSLVNGILLRPLPYARPEELVALWERNLVRGADRTVVSEQNFAAWRARSRSFSAMAAMTPIPLTLDTPPIERISGAQVSPAYFRLLGAHPAIGRDFTDADETNGGTNVVILSDAMWRSRFGADSSIVGRVISMDGESYTVIGVMPPSFEPPSYGWMTEHPVWLPFGANDRRHDWGRFLHVIARRRSDVSIEQARAELAGISARLAREIEADKDWSTTIVPLADQMVGDVRKPLVVVFSAVLLLLTMSVVNVANLIAAFTRRRAHELAVRRAIGATSGRLLRQQLVLSGTLGLMGAVAGLVMAIFATRVLAALMPADVPRVANAQVDGRVLLFGIVVAFASAILFGCVSALRGFGPQSKSLDLIAVHRATPRLDGSRLIATEVAIGLVLSVLAALMIRSLIELRSVDLGFETSSAVAGRISLPGNKYTSPAQQTAFFAELLARVRSAPGVASASIATTRPFACCAPTTVASDAAKPPTKPSDAPTTDIRYVDDAYFSTLRIPILAGTTFTKAESPDGPPRAVISRSLASALWQDENPIGRTVSVKLFGTTNAKVIGVVGDVHLADARTSPRPTAFLSTTRFPSAERDIIVRGSGDAGALLATLRQSLAALDATIPLYRQASLETAVAKTFARDRLTTILLTAFALLSLVLASVGVYGVLAADVVRRRREIGIRLALGAKTSSVPNMVLLRVLKPAGLGIVVGSAVALLVARSMSALVYGVGVNDPASFVAVIVVLLLVAVAAALIPALRATRVSPLEAIRTE